MASLRHRAKTASPRPRRASSVRAATCRADERPPVDAVVVRSLSFSVAACSGKQLGQIARELADTSGPGCVGSVVTEQMPVLLDHRAAARGIHDDGLGARFDVRPPRIDVSPRVFETAALIAQMMTNGATTARGLRRQQLDPERIEHARSGGVDVGRHRRLNAACEQQHLSCMRSGWPAARAVPARNARLERDRAAMDAATVRSASLVQRAGWSVLVSAHRAPCARWQDAGPSHRPACGRCRAAGRTARPKDRWFRRRGR